MLAELPKLPLNSSKPSSIGRSNASGIATGFHFRGLTGTLRAIDEADAEPEDRDIDISEAERIAKSWTIK